jgi:hypothetical protein
MTLHLFSFTAVAVIVISAAVRAADAPSPCLSALERSAQTSAPQIFDAVSPCMGEKRSFEATLLLVQGQIRAMTDMELLPAQSDADKLAAAQLYGRIFYQTGGAGDPEIYRNPPLTQKLFDRIEGWLPTLPGVYDPGWHYAKRPSESQYAESIQYQKEYRLAQLRWYASLVRNDQYYLAEKELTEIQRRNLRGIVQGSTDGIRSQELSQAMNRVVASVGQPQLPKPRPFVYTPDPDAPYKQLFAGFNGPQNPSLTVIRNEAEARASWLNSAMSPEEFKSVLSQTSFDSQVLVAFAMGERDTATGRVYVTDVSYNALLDSFSAQGYVGVNEPDCTQPRAKSHPYAVAIAKRPPKPAGGSGYDVGNFADGCKPVRADASTAFTAPPH